MRKKEALSERMGLLHWNFKSLVTTIKKNLIRKDEVLFGGEGGI